MPPRLSKKDTKGKDPVASQNRSETTVSGDKKHAGTPPKKRRKQRQQYSCVECRRLKLKCDRESPCANCVRRSCVNLCPNGPHTEKHNAESNALRERLEALESVLSVNGISVPASSTAVTNEKKTSTVPVIQPKEQLKEPPSTQRPKSPAVIGPHLSMGETSHIQTSPVALDSLTAASQVDSHIDFVLPTTSFENMISEAPGFDFTEPSYPNQGLNAVRPQEEGPSFGTLAFGRGGRSKWLGPTAGSEWLRDQEAQESVGSPGPSRWPSPERRDTVNAERISVFPFDGTHWPIRTRALLDHLPPLDEGRSLVDSYFRYFSWHYNIARRSSFEPVLDRVYTALQHLNEAPHSVDLQELALVYIVFALGALHNLEIPPNDKCAEEYLTLAKNCLSKSDFLANNTLAGVQTLHIMAHYHLETEKGRNGDSAWPLWGLALRITQAMGLHRDGARWNLPVEIVDERRRVFWESHAADIFQANCFSRPSTISPEHIDTAFPSEPDTSNPEKGFFTLKFELAQISGKILNQAMKVQAPPYSTILELHNELCDFEKNIPYHMRCRSALLSLPSVHPDQSTAIRDSPDVSKRNLALSFQQCTLAINTSETILFLHRPYYAKALYSDEQDPTLSVFGPSYLAVIERCNAIIAAVSTLHSLHPNVSARHWFLWYHVFNCGVVMGTLVLKSPGTALAAFALSQIDAAIALYTSVAQGGMAKRMVNNLEWLVKLRARAYKRMNRVPNHMPDTLQAEELSDEDDVGLIGWRTRLIQRAGKGAPNAITINSTSPYRGTDLTTPSPGHMVDQHLPSSMKLQIGRNTQQTPAADQQSTVSSNPMDTTTDQLLHQFWDPMMMQEIPGTTEWNLDGLNWWDWDKSGTPRVGGI